MKISRDALDFARGLAESSMPEEIIGLLRETDGVITDVLLAPQTEASETQVFYREESLPIDPSVIGSVHSHPNGVLRPSDTDLKMFGSRGRVHIILGAPYGPRDWRAYDRRGREIRLEVVDVETEDPWLDEFSDLDEFSEEEFQGDAF